MLACSVNRLTMKCRFPAPLVALGLALLFAAPLSAQPAIPDTAQSSPAPADALQGAQLLQALRAGGLVIYFRHTDTDFSRSDAGMRSMDDCDNQRLLSSQGRADAAAIGEQIRRLGIALGESLASPYCRTMDHATRMLGPVEPTVAVRAPNGETMGLKRLLAQPVAPGQNRWIVGHGSPFRAIAGPPHLNQGEAVVIRPQTDHWTVIARLQVADWARLAATP